MKHLIILAAIVLVSACGSASDTVPTPDAAASDTTAVAWPTPDPADVTTLDGIMQAYYDVVSGPAGEVKNWNRDKSLHLPDAQVVITRTAADGSMGIDKMTITEYHDRQQGPADAAFYEYEIHRSVRQHGSTVHVWSTYEHTSTPGGAGEGQGVNSIEMIWDGSRYWIASWNYDGRRDAPPVPAEYLSE